MFKHLLLISLFLQPFLVNSEEDEIIYNNTCKATGKVYANDVWEDKEVTLPQHSPFPFSHPSQETNALFAILLQIQHGFLLQRSN